MTNLRKNDLCDKVVAFCGDNCNTNFGGVKRKGQNNIFRRLQQELKCEIVGVGCAAHICHNCLHHAVDVFPIDVEVIVVKIYKFFYIYTVRVTELKEFCSFAEVEYKRVLEHGNTRFLSLLPAVETILRIFPALKAYFLSQEKCPVVLRKFFEDESGEMYLLFIHGQLNLFNSAILAIEKMKVTATDVVFELNRLKTNLSERKDNKFIPVIARRKLRALEEEGLIRIAGAQKEFDSFYRSCLEYLDLWGNSFGGGEQFLWIRNKEFCWTEVEEAAEKVNEIKHADFIDQDALFDEVVLAKSFWSSKMPDWEEEDVDIQDKWIDVFRHFKYEKISISNLQKVMEYIFTLPGTSAAVERVFSIMNNVWSAERSSMTENTVRGLLLCKTNIDLSCVEFHEKIKNNKPFLRKMLSNEKYSNNNNK